MKIFALIGLFLVTVPFAFGQTPATRTVKLYFPNRNVDGAECGVKVFPVTRTIPGTAGVARATLQQLFAGPNAEEKAKGFYSDFSEETKSFFLSVNVKNKIAYVNLSDPTLTPSMGNFTTSCGGSNFFGQVEKTLKQFPSIKTVVFAINGDPSLFYDWMQIGECPKELKNCDASNFLKL
ncbi:MAG TPA: GerMN domain-containing protein [Pyrinomonadaceae bacterium]|nr:GerMN domain-containing protein [Pyrinomonadaceae bacterium]